MAQAQSQRSILQDWLPRIVLAPSFAVILLFVHGFILFTGVLSFTGSKLLPDMTTWVGLNNYARLFNHPNWWTALANLGIFGSLYIIICGVLGLGLAILLDQKIRGKGFLRPIYLYPMALSFIVTGVAWKWFLDPGIGFENVMQSWGWESFSFRWIKEGRFAIHTIVIAAINVPYLCSELKGGRRSCVPPRKIPPSAPAFSCVPLSMPSSSSSPSITFCHSM